MNKHVELNAVMNLQILKDELADMSNQQTEVMPQALDPVVTQMETQLDLLERYLIMLGDVISGKREDVVFWHDLKANKDKFPLNKDRS